MKQKKGISVSRILIRTVLIGYSIMVVFPILWMVLTSLKSSKEIISSPWTLPETPQFVNFVNAWNKGHIGQYFLNSLLIVSITLVILTLLSTATAYVLARFKFKGSSLIENSYMAAMLLPAIVAITPIFLQMRDLQLINNRFGLIVILVFALMPFSVFLMIGFFKSIPREYEEAAWIDGCSYFQTFFYIALPMARNGLVTLLIFNFIYAWNDYTFALILMTEDSKKTLQLGLANLAEVQKFSTDWGALFAGLVLVTIPIIIIYLIFQEKATEGLASGGIKG